MGIGHLFPSVLGKRVSFDMPCSYEQDEFVFEICQAEIATCNPGQISLSFDRETSLGGIESENPKAARYHRHLEELHWADLSAGPSII